MPDYGYNPSQYLNDFSWIDKIGDSISKFAYQVPELIELNKQIKENNKSKDLIYSSVNRYFDKLDPKVVSNIASSMNLGLDPNSPTFDKDARAALKKTIPTFTNNTKNEDYTNQVISSFIPVIRAAQSNAGGGALGFGDLLSGIEDERVYEGVKASTYGKEQTANEQYALGQQRKEQEFKKETEMLYGRGGRSEQSMTQADEFKTDKSNAVSKIVDQATMMVDSEYEDRPVSFTDFDKRRNKALAKVVSLAKDNPTINVEAAKEQIRSEFDDIWDRLVKSKEMDMRQRAEANDLKIARDKEAQQKVEDTNPKVTEQQLSKANEPKIRDRDMYTGRIKVLEGKLSNPKLKPNIKAAYEKEMRDLEGKVRYLDTFASQTQKTLTDFGSVTGPDAGRRSAAAPVVKLNQMESDIDRTVQMLSDYKEATINVNKKGKGAIEKKYKEMVDAGVAGEPGQGRPFVLYNGKIALNPQYNAYKDFLQTGKRPTIEQVYSKEEISKTRIPSQQPQTMSMDRAKLQRVKEYLKNPNLTPEQVDKLKAIQADLESKI